MITRTLLTPRAYRGEEDLQPIVDLINACDAVDQLHENTDVENLRVQLSQPGFDAKRDARLWEDNQGRIMALISVQIRPDEKSAGGYTYWQVHPEVRESGIESDLFAWAENRTKEGGQELGKPAVVCGFSEEANTYMVAQLQAHGFETVRYFFEMRRPLDDGNPIPEPQFPEGFTLRHVANDDDVERWVEMFNLSFIDHWDFHPVTVERRRHRMTSPYYRPDRDLIAVAPDGTFAAFCLCSIDDEHNKRSNLSDGWIDVLGTRRGFRKIGLGRAMLIAGLHKLKENNVETAVLGVDADNPTGALGLYESAGFYKAKTALAVRKAV